MEFKQRAAQNFEIVEIHGEVESLKESDRFKEILFKIINESGQHLAVSFEHTPTLPSDFINVIMSAHIAMEKIERQTVLIGSVSHIIETLELVGIPMLMSMYVDEESFREACLK